MSDPFAILRDELVGAAERAAAAPSVSPRRRWRWLRRRSHPLVVVLGALVVSASAAAGLLSLNGSSSQPLAGRVPGAIEPASVAGYRYTITVTPNLAAGWAFWNTAIVYNKEHTVGAGGGGGSQYPTASNPLFGSDDALDFTSVQANRHGDIVGYVLTSPAVAAIRIGQRTIRTFSSPQLPTGDRAAVFFLPKGSPQLVFGWHPGEPIRATIHIRHLLGYHGPFRVATVAVLPLTRAGTVIPTRVPYQNGSFPYFWQAPSAVTPNNQQPPWHGPTRPLPGMCELAQHGLPGLTPEWGHAIKRILPARDAVGELFVSCIDTHYYLHGWPLTASVLLDARRPGSIPGAIPGAVTVAGYPRTVDVPRGRLSARRVGNAWLVVDGGSGLVQRLEVLRALTISRLDLHSVGK
jgi:hypothetical protein